MLIHVVVLISFSTVAQSPWGLKEWTVTMETQSQASSAAEKKKRVETIVATKGSSARTDISEKAVASSTTSNGKYHLLLYTGTLWFMSTLLKLSRTHVSL